MARFDYSALDVNGNVVVDHVDAADEAEARRALLLANLDVRSVREHTSFLRRDIGREKRVKPVEILHMTRQLAAFLRAGLTLVDGLALIGRSTTNPTLARALHDVCEQVREGTPFDQALADHERLLPRYYLGVVRSSSLTGRLDETLEQLSAYMEREQDARGRIRAALAYPTVIIGMSVASIAVLTVWVLPRFVDLFDQLRADLPLSTRMLMGVAHFSQHFWFVYVVIVALVAVAWSWVVRSERGRRWRDHVLFRLPIVGEVVLYAGVERVCRILSALWSAGVPVADSMEAAVQSADNAVFVERLTPVKEAVLAGEGLAGPIAECGLFPDAAVQMIAVGEATGTMAEQLEHAADFYGRELEVKLHKVTSYFEPAVIVLVGVVVGFVAIALVQAMYGSLSGSSLRQ